MSVENLLRKVALLNEEDRRRFSQLYERWQGEGTLTVEKADRLLEAMDRNPKRYSMKDLELAHQQMPDES